MHLHDRHGAHLTLPADWKQAAQRPVASPSAAALESFSYTPRGPRFEPDERCDFVSISLHGVTQIFHLRIFWEMPAN